MSDLSVLTTRRDNLLEKIREIEASCEGIENENNAKRVQELNLEQAQYQAQRQEVVAKLAGLDGKLSSINAEILKLSGTGIEKILKAIKNQRWYFIKNQSKILFDRNTGLVWANLNIFPYNKNNNTEAYYLDEIEAAINNYTFGIDGFRIPTCYELWKAVEDRTIPFNSGSNYRLFGICYWACSYDGRKQSKDLDYSGATAGMSSDRQASLIPCSDIYIVGTDYEESVNLKNPVYTEIERLQFTLDLFTQNKLWPIFDDEGITELYKKIYFEKPKLLEQLQELQSQIEELQTVTLLSSDFDYTALLAKYDIKAIDDSVIKYYQAVQQWCMELMEKLDYYEDEKASVIRDFNLISLKLSKKYEDNPSLTQEENVLLRDRQRFFQKKFSLGMNTIKTKILAVKKQADELE